MEQLVNRLVKTIGILTVLTYTSGCEVAAESVCDYSSFNKELTCQNCNPDIVDDICFNLDALFVTIVVASPD